MDVRQLMILRELGDRGSVSAVAAALHLTPSAISQQLAALQRGLPVPLTRLQGRTLTLTDAGRALAESAADVAAALARAENAVQAHLDDPTGTVRIAAFHSAASAFFPPLLTAVPEGLRLECSDRDVAQDRFATLTAEHDVVIAHRPDTGTAWPVGVVVTPLLVEPLDVALPADHPLARRRAVTAADVARLPWIAVHDGFPLLAPLHAVSATAGHSVHIAHRINDFTVATALVAAGGGVALLPRFTAPVRDDVVLRPIRELAPSRRIDALSRPERAVRTSVSLVLESLRAVAGSLSG